jgi:hypothetical protein
VDRRGVTRPLLREGDRIPRRPSGTPFSAIRQVLRWTLLPSARAELTVAGLAVTFGASEREMRIVLEDLRIREEGGAVFARFAPVRDP